MKKILFDYEESLLGNDNVDGYYLEHPYSGGIWIATINYPDDVRVSWSYGFKISFKKDIYKLSNIYGKLFSTQEQAKVELKAALENIGFKIISKDMEVYL